MMSGRANIRRSSNHRATLQSGYCLIGILSYRVTVSRATINQTKVRSSFSPSGHCPVGLIHVGTVSSGKCLSGWCTVGLLCRNHFLSINAIILNLSIILSFTKFKLHQSSVRYKKPSKKSSMKEF